MPAVIRWKQTLRGVYRAQFKISCVGQPNRARVLPAEGDGIEWVTAYRTNGVGVLPSPVAIRGDAEGRFAVVTTVIQNPYAASNATLAIVSSPRLQKNQRNKVRGAATAIRKIMSLC